MLKEYSISDILGLSPLSSKYIPYYIGTFEDTDDPDIEWAHRHSFYSLVWFTHGNGFYVVDFQEYEIKPQRIFIVNTKQIHNWDYSANSKGYILMFDPSLGLELGIANLNPFIDIQEPYISTLESCFLNLIREFELNDAISRSNIKTGIQYLYSIILRITKGINSNEYNSVINNFRILVFEENLKFSTVEKFAEILQISTDELNRICKECTGVSSKQYILDLKITEAKRLLLFSKLNVSEIAFHLGFDDSSYFSRIFKKKTNLSPSDFLKKYRDSQ